MAVTENGQWEVDGLALGRGTVYPIESVQGLGVPESKTNDRERGGDDGGYSGEDHLAPREVLLAIGIDGDPDSTAYGEAFDALGEVFAPRVADVVVSYRRFGRSRRFYARPRGLVIPWEDDFHMGAGHAAARLTCADPVIYADAETQVTGSGTFVVTNDGNYKTWPLLTVTGPGSSVFLVNDTDNGKTIRLDGLGGTASVDPRRKTVTVGGSDAYGTVQPRPAWWHLVPGANSITVTGATSLTVTYRHGWNSG